MQSIDGWFNFCIKHFPRFPVKIVAKNAKTQLEHSTIFFFSFLLTDTHAYIQNKIKQQPAFFLYKYIYIYKL